MLQTHLVMEAIISYFDVFNRNLLMQCHAQCALSDEKFLDKY